MKKLLVILMAVLLIGGIGGVAQAADGEIMVLSTSGNPNIHSYTWTGPGLSYIRGSSKYESLTCHIIGTAGTMNVDIDGSINGTTFYGMAEDITAVGGSSIVNQPFNTYLVDVDACSGGCSVKIICQPMKGNGLW